LPQTFADTAQTIKSFSLGDPTSSEDYDRIGFTQAKAQCLSGKSAIIVAKRLEYLPPLACPVKRAACFSGVAEANICVRLRLSSEAGG
jgi:hypothetical protein